MLKRRKSIKGDPMSLMNADTIRQIMLNKHEDDHKKEIELVKSRHIPDISSKILAKAKKGGDYLDYHIKTKSLADIIKTLLIKDGYCVSIDTDEDEDGYTIGYCVSISWR